jgi:NADPH:quinone reductase-like Zn-dependent oxidoreductase
LKRIQYHRYGGPEVMRLEEFALPDLRRGEIAVRVAAASVNPVDWKARNGAVRLITGWRFPRAMGHDFAGVVDAAGPGVTRLKPGDAVLGTARFRQSGAFAEVLVTRESLAVAKPDGLSFAVAACLPTIAVTAWNGLVDKARVRPGEAVFVHGCLGGVGRAAVQIAAMHGAAVGGSCRADAMAEARALGVEPVVDFARTDLSALDGRFAVVFDTAGTLSVRRALALLRPDGGLFIDINPTPAKLLRGAVCRRYRLVVAHTTPDTLARVAAAAASGRLTPVIGKTVALSEAIPAIAALEATRRPRGKLVIVPD